MKRLGYRTRLSVALLLGTLAGCANLDTSGNATLPADMRGDVAATAAASATPVWSSLDAATQQTRLARLMPSALKDRLGWAADLHVAYQSLGITPSAPTFCASIAVIEQESGFQVDPVVPGLPGIVRRELERRLSAYSIPLLLLDAALLKKSPDGRSYSDRIAALKTERQLSDLFEDMIAELPFGEALLADKNPIHTAGPMQVSISFAEQHAAGKPYPYATSKRIRDEVFTRRGGLYFGAAILLDYPAPYDDVLYRFADFNAGRFSSRNAAFQAALARVSGVPVTLDGDLLRYQNGKSVEALSGVENALLAISHRLNMSRADIRRDLLLEKSAGFGDSELYQKLFQLADAGAGKSLPRQAMPAIDLKSPKITRKLTTDWFAHRVKDRYRQCLARDSE